MSSLGILAYFLEATDFGEDANSITSVYETNRVDQYLYEVVRVIICKKAVHRLCLAYPLKNHFLNLLSFMWVWNLRALFDLFLEKFTSLKGLCQDIHSVFASQYLGISVLVEFFNDLLYSIFRFLVLWWAIHCLEIWLSHQALEVSNQGLRKILVGNWGMLLVVLKLLVVGLWLLYESRVILSWKVLIEGQRCILSLVLWKFRALSLITWQWHSALFWTSFNPLLVR